MRPAPVPASGRRCGGRVEGHPEYRAFGRDELDRDLYRVSGDLGREMAANAPQASSRESVERGPALARHEWSAPRVAQMNRERAVAPDDLDVVVADHAELAPMVWLVIRVGNAVRAVCRAVSGDEHEAGDREARQDQPGHYGAGEPERSQASLFQIRHVTPTMSNAGR